MATKKAKKKSTTAGAFRFPKFHRVTISKDQSFKPDPVKNLKHGDFIRIFTPPNSAVDLKWTVKVSPGGGSGGPIVIHS
jgi:hypothetical protein